MAAATVAHCAEIHLTSTTTAARCAAASSSSTTPSSSTGSTSFCLGFRSPLWYNKPRGNVLLTCHSAASATGISSRYVWRGEGWQRVSRSPNGRSWNQLPRGSAERSACSAFSSRLGIQSSSSSSSTSSCRPSPSSSSSPRLSSSDETVDGGASSSLPQVGAQCNSAVASLASFASLAIATAAITAQAMAMAAKKLWEVGGRLGLPEEKELTDAEGSWFASLTNKNGRGVLLAAAVVASNNPLPIIARGVAHWLEMYSLVLMIRVMLSWFPNIPWEKQPWLALRELCDPFLNLFRYYIPPLFGALDVSPMVAFMFLGLLMNVLNVPSTA
ncbi:hypothetical protein CBR_g19400 [Chara braunii]|uniref:YGGT family protein n=1 Tax=Chara braunii TaxID=69332 RepID=A0A388KXV9_CHABU|nr:hypothetical protein CBR_g19400 [Chara braunii]|eukprot:GBG74887.1 hypothetical protein CBR_g19400 [Chara braunii]